MVVVVVVGMGISVVDVLHKVQQRRIECLLPLINPILSPFVSHSLISNMV